MEIRSILWEETMPLRHRVLWPNKMPAFCLVVGDQDALHFGAFKDNVLVSVASVFVNQHKARLRKFATDECFQNQGIGSKVLLHIISSLKESKTESLWCDARETAVDFYMRFGLYKASGRFYKSGVPYFKMEIIL
jgi:predicted GNAT family N-acyltransferase